MTRWTTKSIVTVATSDDDDDNLTDGICHKVDESYSNLPSEILHGFLIACFIGNTRADSNDLNQVVEPLKKITGTVESFINVDQCVDFLTDISDKKVLMIIYDYSDDRFLALLADIPQLCSIHLFGTRRIPNGPGRKIKKFRGMYHDVEQLCHSIKQDIHRQWTAESTTLSIIAAGSSQASNELESSFMYTQLLKEIIVGMDYDAGSARRDFVTFCRQRLSLLDCSPNRLDLFERTYEHHSPIWWYTTEAFVYRSLNRALRTQDTELIMKMGFYIKDCYREVEQRKTQLQISSAMIVYRGQALSDQDFAKMRNSRGGLLSFNNFLSTSRNRDVALPLAVDIRDNTNSVGILFEMQIDPSISSSTFLSIDGLSQFKHEQEILFLMHSVFRIGEINQLEERLWQVNLLLTDDNDEELSKITHCLRDEILSETGWNRMGLLMLRLGKFDKALEIHSSVLEATIDDDRDALEMARGKMAVKTGASYLAMGIFSNAISNLEEGLAIFQRYLSPDQSIFAEIYFCLGIAQYRIGDYPSCLSNYQKAEEIFQSSSSEPQSIIAFIYNGIGLLHQIRGDYPLAISYFEKTREIHQIALPRYHPDLVSSLNNLAVLYIYTGYYSKALDCCNEMLIIQQRSFPANHPCLGILYFNIASIHLELHDYPSSLQYFEKALENREKTSPGIHQIDAVLIRIYHGMTIANRALNNHSAAVANSEKVLVILREPLLDDHPDAYMIHTTIAINHCSNGDHSDALDHLEKALQIQEKSLPTDHPSVATTYAHVGTVHNASENYPLALSYYQKELYIRQKTLPPHHPDLANTFRLISQVQLSMGNYLLSVSNEKNALHSQQQLLSQNPSLTERSSNSTNSDAEYLQYQSMATTQIIGMSGVMEKLLTPTQSEQITSQELLDCCDTISSAVRNMEKALSIHPTSVLLGCEPFEGSSDPTREALSTMMKEVKKSYTISKEQRQLSTDTNNIDDQESSSLMFSQNLSNLIASSQTFFDQSMLPPIYEVNFYNKVGEIFCGTGQYYDALSIFEKVLDKLIKSFSSAPQLLAKTYDNMTTALEGLERIEKAMYSAEQAAATASAALGPDHPDTQAYQTHLEQVRRKLRFL